MKVVALGKAELQQVMDVMALTRDVASPGELRLVVEAISRLVPHEFGAIGSFRTPNPERLTVTVRGSKNSTSTASQVIVITACP